MSGTKVHHLLERDSNPRSLARVDKADFSSGMGFESLSRSADDLNRFAGRQAEQLTVGSRRGQQHISGISNSCLLRGQLLQLCEHRATL